MLAVFFGTDRGAVRDNATLFLQKECPGQRPETIDAATFEAGQLLALSETQSLFGGTTPYLLDTPSTDTAFETEVLEHLEALAASPHVFVVLEGRLLAAVKKRYEKHAATSAECNAEAADRFNLFGLADALAKRDKKNLWVQLQEARLMGVRPEEIAGILWWQLKALRLAECTTTAEQAGMKEYPYKKAKTAIRNFATGEVAALSRSLLELYHEAHQGKGDMELRLEAWCLAI